MISTSDKIKIFNEILPFGFMYDNDEQRSLLSFENGYSYYLPFDLKQDFETDLDFKIAVKMLHRKNVMSFLLKAISFDKNDFINFIQEQFYLCKNKDEDCVSMWLESVNHFLITEHNVFEFQEGLNEKRGAFLKWYTDIKKTIPKDIIERENKLTINQIALKLVYENAHLTKENANETIKNYGYTSGHKLYQEFNFYHKRNNRTANPDKSKKVLENKINLFKSVIDLLDDKFKRKAIDECETLKTYLIQYQ
jgi:hypothetical protein